MLTIILYVIGLIINLAIRTLVMVLNVMLMIGMMLITFTIGVFAMLMKIVFSKRFSS
jgi:predicted membrane channel-forming protein YqfA (hemolysin III family)